MYGPRGGYRIEQAQMDHCTESLLSLPGVVREMSARMPKPCAGQLNRALQSWRTTKYSVPV